jgi:type IVB pilus formation R64 PilN family outer membrane protein
MNELQRAATMCVALISLVGCSGLERKLDSETEAARLRADARLQSLPAPTDERSTPEDVTIHDGIWIAKTSMKLTQAEALPKSFLAPATFNRRVSSISEFAERITQRTDIPAVVTPDALQAAMTVGRTPSAGRRMPTPSTIGSMSGATALPAPASLQTPFAVPPFSGQNTSGLAASGNVPQQLVYREGSLKGLLDVGATRFGVSWRYANGTIEFFHTDTRTFQISALPGDAALNAGVGDSSASGIDSTVQASPTGGSTTAGSGGTSGSGSQNAQVKTELSVFSGLNKTIESMLSTYGSVVSSPATGTVTVSDTPEILTRVEKYIERENKMLSRQVVVNVTVLSVSMSDADNYGVNWNLVYGDLFHKFGIQNMIGTPTDGSSSFSAAILGTSSSKFAGSSLMINALSSQGKVRKETSASVATLNNQPVPVQVARQTAYLKSSETTVTANVGTTTTLTPGVVTSGFTMTILPNVMDNGSVMLQFSTSISSLRSISTVSSNGTSGSTIQTPEIDTRNFLQRVAMKSGQTLVISGFEQIEGNLNKQGVGTPSNFVLGGGSASSSTREVIVILITPITIASA